jgi:phosphoesterase RecJ-like protein
MAAESLVSANIREIACILKTKERIAVLPHNSVDGDTLGSSLAACLALRKLGKRVSLIYEEDFPEHLSTLRTDRDFFVKFNGAGDFAGGTGDFAGVVWDAIIVFDTADPKLLGQRERLLSQTDALINVDHHITNKEYGKHNVIDPAASATAELSYRLILALGVRLDYDMALAIYTGISTDTGGFSYTNTTAASHEIAAKTLQFDIDVAHLRYKYFDAITIGKLHCHGYVANALKLHEGGRYAIVVVAASALAEIGAGEDDCEGLVNIGRNIVGVVVSAFAREVRPGEFRVNLRARGDFDVAAVARRFNGGGHRAAAGCTIMADARDIEGILLDALNAESE